MSFRRVRRALLAAMLATGTAQAQTVAITSDLAKIVAAAEAESTLSLRSTNTVFGGPEGAATAQDGINKTFGTHLKVDWAPGPAYGPLAALLLQEFEAGQKASSDVYLTTAVQITPYLEKGLFQKVDWVKLLPSRITSGMVEAEGRALRIQTVLPGILYNVKAAPWVPAIETSADLLQPALGGKYDTTPFLAGFDVLLAGDVWGVEKTQNFVRQFSQQLAGLAGCEATDRIASGEIPALVVDCSGGAPNRLQYRGTGILANHVIRDMAQKREDYLAIPANAPHPNAAILYTLYAMTHEGQEHLVYDWMGDDLYDFPDSHVRQEADALAARGFNLVDVTIEWWRSHPGLDAANAALAKLVREK